MNIFNRILNDQINKKNNNDNIFDVSELEINNNNNVIIENNNINNNDIIKETNDDIQIKFNENTFENILSEIQEHEFAMEKAIKNADELANATKDSIMYYLDIQKPNKHGILFEGVPDVLNASAKLLDLSITGRYKLANMKKLRASILKDSKEINENNEFNLLSILNEDDDNK